ncbi:MAG TPA: lipopolysaccharide kinase InaA family protein [Planctomycetota bacterium]|nr:lipopolysaccharide kinase InaA family protein [Planctomycetota bacterium]
MLTPSDLERLAARHRSLLKQEPATTVEVLGCGEDAVVRKTYRNLGRRWLQSFGRRSRARREFDNLAAVARGGVPCTTPLAWSERRRLGCIDECSIVTRYLPDSRTLKRVLSERPRPARDGTRARLAAAMGRLLAALHDNGFLWCTAMPRNVLVLGAAEHARLAVCDTPAGIRIGRSLRQGRLARIDLFDAAFSPSRRADFSATERLRSLLAYCDGERARARRLWRALTRRSVLRHDVGRALAMFWHTYILLPLRPGRRHRNDPAR